jgi:hypothetical protein
VKIAVQFVQGPEIEIVLWLWLEHGWRRKFDIERNSTAVSIRYRM